MHFVKVALAFLLPFVSASPSPISSGSSDTSPALLAERQIAPGQYVFRYNSGDWLVLAGVYGTIDAGCDRLAGKRVNVGGEVWINYPSASAPNTIVVRMAISVPADSPSAYTIDRNKCVEWMRIVQDKTAVIRDGVRQTQGGFGGFYQQGQWAAIAHFDPNRK